jgi:hypothetical protein
LVYSQSGTLYELYPNAPRPSTNPSKPFSTTHAYVITSSVKTQSNSQSISMTNRSVTAPTTGSTSLSLSSTLTQISKVNVIQSTSPPPLEGGKKTKKNNNQIENEKTQPQPPATEK